MKRAVCIISFLWVSIILYGEDIHNSIILPSPQTRLFENFVDKFSTERINEMGAESISIPLYSIQIGDLTIPISLQYMTSGVRYKQNDGEFGLGWNLSSLYRISRQVFSKKDEEYKNLGVPENLWTIINSKTQESYFERDKYVSSFLRHPPSGAPSTRMPIDGGNDVFRFNLPSSVGNFIIEDITSQRIRILESTNEKISFNLSQYSNSSNIEQDINRFTLVGDDGYIYNFGNPPNINRSSNKSNLELTSNIVTAWPIQKITAPNLDEIIYEYKQDNYGKDQWIPSSQIVTDGAYYPDNMKTTANYSSSFPNYSSPYDIAFAISSISTDREIITFVRENYKKHHNRVTKIIVYDKGSRKEIREIIFKYNEASYNESSNHYLLESVEIRANSKLYESYSFKYNLPQKNSYLVADQWGYYLNAGDDIGVEKSKTSFYHEEIKNLLYFDSNDVQRNVIKDILNVNYVNRSKNEDGATFSLTEIKLPTGGMVQYEYEPNYFYSQVQKQKYIKGGGIRVKQKSLFDSVDSKHPQRSFLYFYGNNSDGLGHATFDFDYRMFLRENISYSIIPEGDRSSQEVTTGQMNRIFSQALFGDTSPSQHFKVLYNQVNVLDAGNGGTIYKYNIVTPIKVVTLNNPLIYPPRLCSRTDNIQKLVYPFMSNSALGLYITSYDYTRNITTLDTISQYNNAGNLVSQKVFKYKLYNHTEYEGATIIPTGLSGNCINYTRDIRERPSHFANPYALNGEAFFQVVNYKIQGGANLLEAEIDITYSETGEIKHKKSYTYDNVLRLSSMDTSNSLGNTLHYYKYPSVNTELYKRNMHSTIIEQKTVNNNTEVKSVKQIYPENSIYRSSTQIKIGANSNYITEITYDQYDSKGNLLQYTGKDKIPVSYIWSYNQQYPIAEIRNQSYSVLGRFYGINVEELSKKSKPNQLDYDKIRSIHSDDVFVTTYTYEPLVGITSITDPMDITTHYIYDDFQRLVAIKDNNREVVESYKYNYSGQEQNSYFVAAWASSETVFKIGEPRKLHVDIMNTSDFDLNYTWTIRGPQINNTFIGKKSYLEVDFQQIGDYSIQCLIKNDKTGKSQTLSKVLEVVKPLSQPRLRISNYADYDGALSVLKAGQPCDIYLELDGGSKNKEYTWIINDKDEQKILELRGGEIVTTSLNSSVKQEVKLNKGEYKLSCIVEDKTLDETVTVEQEFIVGLVIDFTDISYYNNSVTAYIDIPNNYPEGGLYVNFGMSYSGSEYGTVYYDINGTTFACDRRSRPMLKKAWLQKGLNKVQIFPEYGQDSSGILYIEPSSDKSYYMGYNIEIDSY